VQSGAPSAETEPNDTPATATPLPANGWVSGARNPAAATEQDWYSFTANAGDTVYLSLNLDPERDNVQWNGRLGIALFGDANNQILVVDDNSTGSAANPLSEAMFMTIKTAGTYFAFVDSATAATGGPTATYDLSVSIHPAVDEGVNCTTYTSTNVPQTIGPGTGLVSSTITVPGNPRIADLDVEIQLNHTLMGDIDAHLRSPAGDDNGLFTDIGAAATGGQTIMNTIFDDEAGATPIFTVLNGLNLKPELAYRLAWFDGEDAGGTWTLDLRDDGANASGGTLSSWSLRICEAPPPPTCAAGFTPTTVLGTDFEAGAAGFTHSGTADEWALGLPNSPATVTANPLAAFTTCASGSNCWKTDLTGTYNLSSSQDLLSPNIDLTGLSPPVVVSWAQRYQMETASFDHLFIDFQQAGGATPIRLFEFLDATMTDAPGNPAVNTGASAGWARMSRRGDALAGLNSELRFHVDSDTSVNFQGLAIDDVSVTACRALVADLAITKTDGVTTATPGGSVTYTITASNAGPDPVTAATVADTFPAICISPSWTCAGAGGGTCTAAGAGNINDAVNLPAGGSVTYTATCPISAAATGSLSNTATVSSAIGDPTPANNSATDADTLAPSADVSVTKTDGLATAGPGQTLNYSIVASNAGPSNAPSVTVSDAQPAACASFTWTCSGAGGGSCTAAGSGSINDTANLPAGGSVTYLAACPIAGATPNGTVIGNTVTVTVGGGVSDPTPGNNSATDNTTVLASADLGITKSDGVAAVNPGQTLNYSIVASNAGPQAVSGASVADNFPAACSSFAWTCSGTGGGTCTAAGSGNIADTVNMPVGATVTYLASCPVNPATPDATVISNTATVAVPAGIADPNAGNNSATDNTTVTAGADVSGTKVVTGNFSPGGAISYSIVLTNNGQGVQNDNPGNEFDDVLPTGITYVSSTASSGTITFAAGTVSWNGSLAAGASVTLTINATINAGASGSIVNQGTIHFDSDANGSNESSRPTDNPALAGPADPTGFVLVTAVPAAGRLGLLVLGLMLLGFGLVRRFT